MAYIGAGDRNVRVRFERARIVVDGTGGEIETWATFANEWAMVSYGNSAERRAAAQTVGSAVATVTVLRNSRARDVHERDRVVIGDVVWNIAGVVPFAASGTIAMTVTRP